MSVATGDDRLHLAPSPDASFRDAVTFAFGDRAARLYGLARLSYGSEQAGGLAVVYAGDNPVAASVDRVDSTSETWDDVMAAGVRGHTEQPLQAWTVAYEGDGAAIDLRYEACSAPAVIGAEDAVARIGGMQGYDQLCRVTGTVSHGGRTHELSCLGQREQRWGSSDPSRSELSRSVSAWFGEDLAVTLTTVRPAKSKGHLDEAVSGFTFQGGDALRIADPRLSTTYDVERRQRRAGLELWMDEDGDVGRRAAGEVLCATTLELGEQRLESAFFSWRMEGREGVGRYDVLRRAGGAGRRGRSR